MPSDHDWGMSPPEPGVVRTFAPCGWHGNKPDKRCPICELVATQQQRDQLRAEVSRLRSALEWYAAHENYDEETYAHGHFSLDADNEEMFEPDCGERARAALKGGSSDG